MGYIYEPASGTGGMLSVANKHLLLSGRHAGGKGVGGEMCHHARAGVFPHQLRVVCQANLLIKTDQQATVHLGNSLIPNERHIKEPRDRWPERKWRFNPMLSNPPFGVAWGGKDGHEKEARKLKKSRY